MWRGLQWAASIGMACWRTGERRWAVVYYLVCGLSTHWRGRVQCSVRRCSWNHHYRELFSSSVGPSFIFVVVHGQTPSQYSCVKDPDNFLEDSSGVLSLASRWVVRARALGAGCWLRSADGTFSFILRIALDSYLCLGCRPGWDRRACSVKHLTESWIRGLRGLGLQ